MDLEIVHADGGHAIGLFGPILIRVITTAPSDLASLEQLHLLTQPALARWPIVAWWIVIHHGAPTPDSDFRRRVGPTIRPYRERLVVLVTPLGLGFWASTAAVVTSALSKLVGQPALLETSIDRGAQRLGMELIGVDAEKLAAAYGELLARIKQPCSQS